MTDNSAPNTTTPIMPAHQPVYDLAEVYDIAFDFRDLDAECDALDAICEKYRGGRPESFLDVACGPGYHCITYANRGRRSLGLDLNPTMLDYARAKAGRSRCAGSSTGAAPQFVHADMRDFTLAQPVDLMFCGMSSIHYLLTNDDIARHLRAAARNLTPGGLYVIEAEHPRDTFGVGQSLKHEWEARRGETTVRTRWGGDDDQFDPISQTTRITVRMDVSKDGDTKTYEFTNVDRRLTKQELAALVENSGVLEAAAWLGVLNVDQPFDNSKQSIRMVPVLRKR